MLLLVTCVRTAKFEGNNSLELLLRWYLLLCRHCNTVAAMQGHPHSMLLLHRCSEADHIRATVAAVRRHCYTIDTIADTLRRPIVAAGEVLLITDRGTKRFSYYSIHAVGDRCILYGKNPVSFVRGTCRYHLRGQG